MSKKMILLLAIALLAIPACLVAQDIPDQVQAQLDSSDIPVFPEAIYCTGNASAGIRFATDETPEKTREWYIAKFPNWSIWDQYGSWILYDGPPNAGMAQVMSGKQILIKKNEQIPSWHSLSSNMTTEITIAFPN